MKRILPLILVLTLLCTTVLCCACSSSKAILLYEGEAVTTDRISITVDADTTEVRLYDKITVHDGYTWKLYADKSGLVEIPTKIAVNVLSGELAHGDNEFYIVATDDNGKYMFFYTVNVFRRHNVTVVYKAGNTTIHQDTAPGDKPYTVLTVIPNHTWDNGYIFGGWKDGEGNAVNSLTFESSDTTVTLYAALTPKTTVVTLCDGDKEPIEATITYGQTNQLPVPSYTQDGYRFAGWELRPDLVSAADGTLEGYNTAYQESIRAYARWETVE